MGLFRAARSNREPDSMLHHKMTVFVLGAVIALIGMSSGNRLIVYVAIGILIAGVVLRLIGSRKSGRRNDDARSD